MSPMRPMCHAQPPAPTAAVRRRTPRGLPPPLAPQGCCATGVGGCYLWGKFTLVRRGEILLAQGIDGSVRLLGPRRA